MVDQKKVLALLVKYFDKGREIVKGDYYDFDSEGRLNVELDITYIGRSAPELGEHRLPIRFGRALKSFTARWVNLTSLEGFPYYVGGGCNIGGNLLTNLVGAPSTVMGSLDLEYIDSLKSLEGFPDAAGAVRFSWRPDLPVLRLLNAARIDLGIKQEFEPESSPAQTCLRILRKFQGQGEAGAFLCGAELAAAGLKENARW